MAVSPSVFTLPMNASSFTGGCQSHAGLPASRTSSLMAAMATLPCSWPNTTPPSITSSDSCSASDSTISTAACVPATTRSILLSSSWVLVGFSTYSPLT